MSTDLAQLTQQQLIERLQAAEREINVMKEELQMAHHAATSAHDTSCNDDPNSIGNSPAANKQQEGSASGARLQLGTDGSVERTHASSELFPCYTPGSHRGRTGTVLAKHHADHQHAMAATTTAQPAAEPYQVSFGVLVIDKERSYNVPLTTVINKSYLRPDEREADTPVVTHRGGGSVGQHDDVSALYYENSRAFSAEMIARMGSVDGAGSFAGGDHSPNANGTNSVYGGNSSNRQDSISNELAADGDSSPVFNGQRQLMGDEANANNGTTANPTVKGLFLKPQALDPNRLSRLHSVGPDALMTNNTLNVFKRTFGGSNRDAMTPVASSALAVFNYLNKFAENGFVHEEGCAEGLGRMMQQLCRETEGVLLSEPRHAASQSPAFVFGDIHGNFRDLHYFMKNLIHFNDLRYTPHRFMFLGDYVDRGEFSVEVVAYLFAMKVIAPEKIALLRGNHEDTLVSGDLGNYGSTSFRAQCRQTFGTILGEDVWNRASQAFAALPLTGSIDKKIFCTHGGLPRFRGGEDNRLAELSRPDYPRLLSFFQVPEDETPEQQRLRQMGTDTCWADPADDERMLDEFGFGANPRGQGVILFGSDAVDNFLDTYGYEMIFRAHQEKADGLKLSKNARVFTIFSTSAYVGHSNGAGVVMVADGKVRLMIKTADNEEYE